MVGIFIHGWKKPSLLAKLVYREDYVFLKFQLTQKFNFTILVMCPVGFVEQLKTRTT